MTKEDLKTGMILEFTNESRGLILDNEIFFINKNGGFSGSRSRSCISDNFAISGRGDIIKVFVPNTPEDTNIGYGLNAFMFDVDFKILVWEKHEVEEMTLEQICKSFGREIKIVKGN